MDFKDYYATLGVPKTANAKDLKQAYRKLARKFHPDVNPSPDAEDRFKEINLAYATLSDSLKRADYDQTLADSGVRRTMASTAVAQSLDAIVRRMRLPSVGRDFPHRPYSPIRSKQVRHIVRRTARGVPPRRVDARVEGATELSVIE